MEQEIVWGSPSFPKCLLPVAVKQGASLSSLRSLGRWVFSGDLVGERALQVWRHLGCDLLFMPNL